MIKKIALWGSLVILTGALAAGAIIRTSALAAGGDSSGQQRGQSAEARGSGGGQGNGQSQGGNGGGQGQGSSRSQGGNGGGQGQSSSRSQGGNRGGQGLAGSRGKGQGSDVAEQEQGGNGWQGGNRGGEQGQAPEGGDGIEGAERLAFEGVAASVDEDALIVALADGGEIIVEGRAWRYAQEQGFAASAGDPIWLDGFYDENDDFEVAYIQNGVTQQAIALREESGRPMWAGGGGRGNP